MSHSPGLVAPATPRLCAAHPQLFVADVAQAAVFYRAKLGFTVEYLYGEPPFYGLVSRDGVGLNLRHTDAPPFDAILREQESLLSANIPVEGVEELFAEFRDQGVDFAQSLKHQPWGTVDFIVRDPDRNLLCFASRVVTQD
jgi:catechol 2,3-dioxygenase-like lactoylglutathione lyase family enzyme